MNIQAGTWNCISWHIKAYWLQDVQNVRQHSPSRQRVIGYYCKRLSAHEQLSISRILRSIVGTSWMH